MNIYDNDCLFYFLYFLGILFVFWVFFPQKQDDKQVYYGRDNAPENDDRPLFKFLGIVLAFLFLCLAGLYTTFKILNLI